MIYVSRRDLGGLDRWPDDFPSAEIRTLRFPAHGIMRTGAALRCNGETHQRIINTDEEEKKKKNTDEEDDGNYDNDGH